MAELNTYEVWTHARGEEAIEAGEFVIDNDGHLLLLDASHRKIAGFSSGSWVSVRQIQKTS